VINQDTLGSREACVREFTAQLRRGKSVVVDRCNHTREQRSTWIQAAVEVASGVPGSSARVYALCLNTDIRECRERIAKRVGHPTLSGEEEREHSVVSRFLSESEEVKNREGLIKIYRSNGSPGRKGGDDELVARILRETSRSRHPFPSSSSSSWKKSKHELNAGAQPFQPGGQSPKSPAAGSAGWTDASKLDTGDRVVLLFDLNGTLINKTKNRHGRKTGGISVRPHVSRLAQLRKRGFVVGIYSSATLKTCKKAVAKLLDHIPWGDECANGASGGKASTRLDWSRLAPEGSSEKKSSSSISESGESRGEAGDDFFQYLLHREFCELAPGIAGAKWDTVKPLGRYVADLNKCILFDDDEYKVLESEKNHHVLVPEWNGETADDTLTCLVESTLKHIPSSGDKDVRIAAATISMDLLDHSEQAKRKENGAAKRAAAPGAPESLTDFSPARSELASLSLTTP